MSFPYSQIVCNALQQEIVKDSNEDMYCIEDHNGTPSGCFSFAQCLSAKTSTSLQSTALVAYPVHVFFLNYFVIYREYIIENRISVLCSVPTQLEATVERDWVTPQKEIRTLLVRDLEPGPSRTSFNTFNAPWSKAIENILDTERRVWHPCTPFCQWKNAFPDTLGYMPYAVLFPFTHIIIMRYFISTR